tara:strand:- start:366 stop:563 length:198 start_codon:yes stop_codon:yes gene_type:complete
MGYVPGRAFRQTSRWFGRQVFGIAILSEAATQVGQLTAKGRIMPKSFFDNAPLVIIKFVQQVSNQ